MNQYEDKTYLYPYQKREFIAYMEGVYRGSNSVSRYDFMYEAFYYLSEKRDGTNSVPFGAVMDLINSTVDSLIERAKGEEE